MDAVSASLAVKALDFLSVRQAVTASNIANAGTPGFRPMRVDFEALLRDAAGQGASAVDRLQPQLSRRPDRLAGPDLRLDVELATASSTALRYSALVDVLNRNLQLQRIAIAGVSA